MCVCVSVCLLCVRTPVCVCVFCLCLSACGSPTSPRYSHSSIGVRAPVCLRVRVCFCVCFFKKEVELKFYDYYCVIVSHLIFHSDNLRKLLLCRNY